MNSSSRPLAFTIFCLYFACTGFATLVSSAAAWHFGSTVPWLALAYAGMNFSLSFAFYMRERWLFSALLLNFAAYTCLYVAIWWSGGDSNVLRLLLSTLVAGVSTGVVYAYRATLSEVRQQYVGYIFFLLWILTFTYSALAVL